MDQEKLGKFIEKLRKDKNWTQKDLGEKLGISNGAVSKWECGNNLPDISMLEPLSKALDIGVMNLLNCKDPSEEERELQKQSCIRKMCFKNLKFLTFLLCLILLISLCCFPLVLRSIRNFSKKNTSNEEAVRVYEFLSNDQENFLVKGYIIYNENETIINITNIKYQSEEKGTIDEIYADNTKVILEIDDKEIYKFISNKENKKSKKISKLIDEILVEKEDEVVNVLKLTESENDFSNSKMTIECFLDEKLIKDFEIEINLNEKFS